MAMIFLYHFPTLMERNDISSDRESPCASALQQTCAGRACASTRLRNPRRAPRQARSPARLGPEPAQRLSSSGRKRRETGLGLPTFGGVAFGSLTNLILCRSACGPTRLSLMYLASTSGYRFASTCLPGTVLSRGGGLGWRHSAHVLKWSPIT